MDSMAIFTTLHFLSKHTNGLNKVESLSLPSLF
jgi:hypothetical protein